MRTLRTLITLLLAAWVPLASGGSLLLNPYRFTALSGITLIASASASSPDGQDCTAGPIDTTGVTFISVFVADYQAAPDTPVSDNKGNTWTPRAYSSVSGGVRGRFHDCTPTSVGSGHTFTADAETSFPSMCVAAFSGVDTTPIDQQSGANNTAVVTLQAGSVTPGSNDQLIVSGLGFDATNTPTIDAGFTVITIGAYGAGVAFGSAIAYKVQTTAAAVNPAWSWSTSCGAAARNATFEKAP